MDARLTHKDRPPNHPEWLSQDVNGATFDGSNYQFDQGLPEVQKHTYNVAMDIISRYDVDGFHFDYVRYSGRTWGYHSNSVERFNRRYNRTGVPATTNQHARLSMTIICGVDFSEASLRSRVQSARTGFLIPPF